MRGDGETPYGTMRERGPKKRYPSQPDPFVQHVLYRTVQDNESGAESPTTWDAIGARLFF